MSAFEKALIRLRAAGEATRLRALLLLREGELTVTELTGLLAQSQPRVSRHLKVLADAGLVDRAQEGAWVFYRLADRGRVEALLGAGAPLPDLMSDRDWSALRALREERAARATAYFAANADRWDDLRARHIDEAEIEANLVEMAGGATDLFLDLGTGTGRMLTVFAPLYRQGVGLDLSPEMLVLARASLHAADISHAQVQRADFMADEIVEEAGLICLHHVLHFLPEPREALAVAARALSPNGRILIADFAPHDHEDLRDEHAHRRLGFSDEEIRDCAATVGLVVSEVRHLNPPKDAGLVTSLWRLEHHTARPKWSAAKKENAPHGRA